MKTIERQAPHGVVRGYLSPHSVARRRAMLESFSTTTWTRNDTEVRTMVNNIPQPPLGYDFNHYQRQQQANFFKWTQDRNVPLHNVDLYNANIVAICMFTLFILSFLYIFYIECFFSTGQCFQTLS